MRIDEQQRLINTLWVGLRDLGYAMDKPETSTDFPQIIIKFSASYSAGFGVIGIRVRLDAADITTAPAVYISLRRNKGVYRQVKMLALQNQNEIKNLLRDLAAVAANRSSILPEPSTFDTGESIYEEISKTQFTMNNLFSARVLGVVSIGADGIAAESNISEPDVEPWFAVDCLTPTRAVINVITDGERFYRIKLSRAMRFGKPIKTRIDEQTQKARCPLGPADKKLIQAAIANWINK